MENRYTVSIVHGEHATLYHVVDAGAPEGEQPDIVLSLHNKPHAQAMAEELNKQAARIRELEGALRDLLTVVHDEADDIDEDGGVCVYAFAADIDAARRVLSEGSVKA